MKVRDLGDCFEVSKYYFNVQIDDGFLKCFAKKNYPNNCRFYRIEQVKNFCLLEKDKWLVVYLKRKDEKVKT